MSAAAPPEPTHARLTWKWLAGTLVTVVFALVVSSTNSTAEKTRELQEAARVNAVRIAALDVAVSALDAIQRELAVKLEATQSVTDSRFTRIEGALDRLDAKIERLAPK